MPHHRRWIMGTMVIFLALTIGLPVTRAQTATPTIQPTAPTISAGEMVWFTGGGFARGERVATWATAPDQTVFSGPYFYAARADGTVELSFSVPGDAMSGRWGFTAYGDRSTTPAIATFDVQGNESSQTRPQDTIEPPVGPPGTEFRFNVHGFRDNEAASYWFTGPDGEVAAAYPNEEEADKRGKVSLQWTAPNDAARGFWVLTIQGLKSGRAKGVRFEIR